MKTTYTMKPLKWRKRILATGICTNIDCHSAETINDSLNIYVRDNGLVEGYARVRVYSGPSVESAKKACERAYVRQLKRALLPVKKD